MRIALTLCFGLCAFALSAQAGEFASVEDRAGAIEQRLAGNESYHAHLARALADIAAEEKGQHDLEAARAFIRMAEEEASKAGGAK